MNLTSIENLLNSVDDFFYTYLLTALLILAGIYLTARSRLVQLRHFGTMVNSLSGSRSGAQGGISSFQAFAVGLASRVGTGNIVGVAIAITMGGPGAVFWMWIVALVGMATGFIEATLAQLYKVTHPDGTFRGGPAYYIQRGLGSKPAAKLFAVVITFVFGFAYEATQANTIAATMESTFHVEPWMTAVALVVITTPIIFKGIKSVAAVSEWLVPIMTVVYALIAVAILVLHVTAIPGAILSIFEGAFGVDQAFAGTAGGFTAALLNGTRRGLFSNEAGEGSVPNIAATATVPHPVQQGFVQSLGVFVDTILVCTATGLLILLTTETYHPGDGSLVGAILTQQAVAEHLGAWTTWPMVVLIFVLVFSTVLGCYSYAQVNVNFLGGERRSEQIFGIVLTAAAFGGTVLTLPVVWALSDIALGLLGVLNLVVIVRLAPWVIGALRDFESQRARGITEPAFVGHGNSLLPGDVVPGIWEPDDVAKRG